MLKIPYHKPFVSRTAIEYIKECIENGIYESGTFQQRCIDALAKLTGCSAVFLTPSCTDALEMAALLLDIGPGDEVIMPSYTFVSTATAFVLRGAIPVFVDIRNDTLNINEQLIEQAITPKTKAIVAVHYAGVASEMREIKRIAEKYGLHVIEDAAQGVDAYYHEQHLGTIGHVGVFSFHHTKNITSGLGGALLVNDSQLIDRAKTIYTKGTNRDAFLNGMVDKYTWVDLGSSFMMCELNACLLFSQLEILTSITAQRLDVWNTYHRILTESLINPVSLPVIPEHNRHNAHIYYLKLQNKLQRDWLLEQLQRAQIQATFHYIPLHNSPAGLKYTRMSGEMTNTINTADTIVRLPVYADLDSEHVDYIARTTVRLIESVYDSPPVI